MQGYQPIIAHPERYIYLEGNKEFYTELKDAGHNLQLNILSLGGAYGRSVQELATWLLKREFYDFAGTDLHGFKHLDGLFNPQITNPLEGLIRSGALLNTTL
jgi:protein-tyrosine phosphatase